MGRIDIAKKYTFIINFVYGLIIIAITVLIIKYAIPMLGPFVAGLVIASLMRSPTKFFQRKLPLSPRLTAALVMFAFYGLAAAAISLVGVEAVTGIRNLVFNLPDLYALHIEPLIIETFGNIERAALRADFDLYSILKELEGQAIETAGSMVSGLSGKAMSAVGSFAYSIPGLIIKLVLLIISSFFIAMDYDKLMGFCLNQLSLKTRTLVVQIKEYVVGTLFVCIRSYALIMSITCVELSIGLSIIGIDHGILIAACISLFDILPVLGTGGIMLPWALITALSGNLKLALSLLAVYIVITIIRNILEPKIVGGQLGLHPVVTLSSMFAGVQLFGVIGLFGFPIGLSLLRYLDETGTVKIFRMPDWRRAEKPETPPAEKSV